MVTHLEEFVNIIGYYNTLTKNPLNKHIELFDFLHVFRASNIDEFIERTKSFSSFWGDLMFPDDVRYRRVKIDKITKDIFNLLIEFHFLSLDISYSKNVTSGDADGFLTKKDGSIVAIKNVFYTGKKEYLISRDIGNFGNESVMKYNLKTSRDSNGKIVDSNMMVFTTAESIHEMVKEKIYNNSILFYDKNDLNFMINWENINLLVNEKLLAMTAQ